MTTESGLCGCRRCNEGLPCRRGQVGPVTLRGITYRIDLNGYWQGTFDDGVGFLVYDSDMIAALNEIARLVAANHALQIDSFDAGAERHLDQTRSAR